MCQLTPGCGDRVLGDAPPRIDPERFGTAPQRSKEGGTDVARPA